MLEKKMRNFLLFDLNYEIGRAKKIKESPEKKETSFRYAIRSVINSILAIPFSALIFVFVQSLDSNSVIITIGGIIIGLLIGVGGTISFLINSIKNFFLQLYINKRLATWISLGIFIISLISCLIIVFTTINTK